MAAQPTSSSPTAPRAGIRGQARLLCGAAGFPNRFAIHGWWRPNLFGLQILFSHRALREYIGEEAFRYAKRCGLCRLPFDIFETMEDICLPRRFREAEFPTLSKHVLTSGVSPHGCGEELLTFTDDLSVCVCVCALTWPLSGCTRLGSVCCV